MQDKHDSIEDAQTALQLYRKYLELMRGGAGVVEETLQQLYDLGRETNWVVPG